MPAKDRHRAASGPTEKAEDSEGVFARPSFYAEFAPLADHGGFVDSIYVLKDRGRLTESRLTFASPLKELTFIFREAAPGGRVVFNEPNGVHRRKSGAFFGWIVGVKFKSTWPNSASADDPAVIACRDLLACVIQRSPSQLDILAPLDRALFALSRQAGHRSETSAGHFDAEHFDTKHDRVDNLAHQIGRSVRTIHRRMRTSTGFPPKRFLAMQRFRRSVFEIAAGEAGLSAAAGDLGFSDQAHLTREFRRHAGVTPGAFRKAWRGPHAQAVRFLQDADRSTRLMMAVWPRETTTKAG
ncbi:AraC family transcriptional regulator [Afipia sp. GAS231]|uniref:helix-turn-helix domain-containing protein n=1 Tax=Afipia sp. GAS231 TaxID=1882747 RepID=UPI00087CC25A|nr:AraC family transcriptional regulator [Afipia sp. GAS231]SDO26367.1 AraC-type DNA-binding protein [Afipia sp. GAS231]